MQYIITFFKLEILLLWRSVQASLYPLAFFCMMLLLLPLAVTSDKLILEKIFPGMIWFAALLAIMMAAENSFSVDLEDQHLEQLLLSPFSLPLSIAIKLCVQWCISVLPIILFTPLLSILFHFHAHLIMILILSLCSGTPLLMGLCMLGSALTIGLQQQGIILGLLILPLCIPVIIFGVGVVQQAQFGLPFSGTLAFLTGLTLLALLILPYAIATLLRLSIDE